VRLLAACLLVLGLPAGAYEGAKVVEVDAGVHVPVLTKAPELLELVDADYPPDALAQGLTASVRMQITIGADGSVPDAEVLEAVGHGFDEAALAAVKRFRFSPAELDGTPAAVQVEYTYHFVLRVADAGVEPEAPDAGQDAGPPPPNAKLLGRLVSRGSRTRIEGATVRCTNQPDLIDALSNAEGFFELPLHAGPCAVQVVASEHEPFLTTEKLERGEQREVVYYVRPKTQGYETVVRAEREKKEVVRRTLDRNELQKIPGSFGDPVRVIQNFPGVARAPFLSGQLIVRGAQPDQTLTFLDGVEIPILYHLGGGPSVVNSEFLDRIDFFPGGFGARYGRAVGGVIDVATRKGATDTYHGVAKIDLQDTSLFFEAPITDSVSVAAAVRRSYIDALLPLVLPKDPEGGSLLILPRYWDYQARADFGGKRGEPTRSTGSVMAFGSDDALQLVATGGGRNRDVNVDFHTTFHRVVGTWNYREGNVSLKTTPYLGYDLGTLRFGASSVRADEYEVGLREDLAVEVNSHLTVRAGVDTVFDRIAGSAELPVLSGNQYVPFPGAEPKVESQRVARQLDSFDGAIFLETDLKIGKLTLTPGLRASHALLDGQTRHAFDPRLWARYELLESTALKGSIGLYTQPPSATDMEPPPFGTPSLTHERAFQSSLGVSHRFTDYINVDLTGFYNRRFENVSSPGPTVTNPDGSVTSQRFANDGLGRAYGLEVMLRHEVSKRFFGWVAYTLARSEERTAGSDKPYVLTSFDQTHILTVVGSVRLPYGFEIGSRFRYVTGRPKSPLVTGYDEYRADANSFAIKLGASRSARVKDFAQLDVRIDKTFQFDSWSLGLFLDVQNILNIKNVEGSFYDYRFRQEYEVPGIPFLPILGVKGSF